MHERAKRTPRISTLHLRQHKLQHCATNISGKRAALTVYARIGCSPVRQTECTAADRAARPDSGRRERHLLAAACGNEGLSNRGTPVFWIVHHTGSNGGRSAAARVVTVDRLDSFESRAISTAECLSGDNGSVSDRGTPVFWIQAHTDIGAGARGAAGAATVDRPVQNLLVVVISRNSQPPRQQCRRVRAHQLFSNQRRSWTAFACRCDASCPRTGQKSSENRFDAAARPPGRFKQFQFRMCAFQGISNT